jgi:hypothetical protein
MGRCREALFSFSELRCGLHQKFRCLLLSQLLLMGFDLPNMGQEKFLTMIFLPEIAGATARNHVAYDIWLGIDDAIKAPGKPVVAAILASAKRNFSKLLFRKQKWNSSFCRLALVHLEDAAHITNRAGRPDYLVIADRTTATFFTDGTLFIVLAFCHARKFPLRLHWSLPRRPPFGSLYRNSNPVGHSLGYRKTNLR